MKLKQVLIAQFLLVVFSAAVMRVSADTVPIQAGPGGAAEYTGEEGKAVQSGVAGLSVFIEESAAYLDEVVRTAARYRGRPYLYRYGDYVVIGNSRVAAVFRSKNNELAGLVDIYNGGRMLAYGNGPLWKVTLADSKKKPAGFSSWESATGLLQGNSEQAVSTRNGLTRGLRKVQLTLDWEGISTEEENRILSVNATVSADAVSPYLYWNITVDNRSVKRGVWQVDFPRLESIVPMGYCELTGLFLPWGQGRVVDNPFAIDTAFTGQYPAPSSPMQYSALYGADGGLFLATHDGKMYIKQFIHECHKDSGTLTYFLRNLPERRGEAGTGYHMPYDFVLTSFKGDWFDAARLYRDWAVKQVWCSGGPLATRKDVPEWYKKLTFWTIQWEQKSYHNWDEISTRLKDYDMTGDDLTVDDIYKIAATIGVPYATHFYGWHKNVSDEGLPEHFPPLVGEDGFRKQIRQIHDAGVRIVPYELGFLWDKSLDSYKNLDVFSYCIKDAVGNSYAWRIDHTKRYEEGLSKQKVYYLDWLCPYLDFTQTHVAEISRKLVEYGVDGIYYDVLSGNCHMCFDPNHGHPTGGGNYWAMGNREILRRSREAIREVNPEAIMLSEQPSEAYLDVLDGILLFHVQSMPGAVPAFQAVYHDYFLLFGNYIGFPAAVDHLPMFAGESFVHGDQLGVFNVWPIFLPDHPRTELSAYWDDEAKRKKNAGFLVHIARMKHNSGYKFLTLGEKRKILALKNDLPILEAEQMKGRGCRSMPAVINSVWKAPDGTLGLVFCNVSESTQEARYTIDVTEYGLPAGRNYTVIEHYENGASMVAGRYDRTVFERVETIPARWAKILEIKPE